jgi:hypothetical protein
VVAEEAEETESETQPIDEKAADAEEIDEAQSLAETAEVTEAESENEAACDEARLLAERLWERALGDLSTQMATATFDTWLRDSQGLTYADGQLRVGTPNAYARAWLEHRMTILAQRAVSRLMQRTVRVVFCERRHPDAAKRRAGRTDFARDEDNP